MTSNYLSYDLATRLSVYRKPLMGFAMLWIFMLHSGETGNVVWDFLRSNSFIGGWAGTDIFFFLSAMGLCNSLDKNNKIAMFYQRRAIRILPTWLTVLLLVHLFGTCCNFLWPNLSLGVPDTIMKCLTWYTGVGFWISSFVSGEGWFYEWYIPSLLVFYLFTPILHKRSILSLTILFLFFFILGFLLYHYDVLREIHFFYHRIPIFILGVFTYRLLVSGKNLSLYFFVTCLFMGGGVLYINSEVCSIPKEYVALFWCPPLMIILTMLFENKIMNNIFSFYGGITLEFYLMHYFFYNHPSFFQIFLDGHFEIILFSLVLYTTMAFVMNKIMDSIVRKVKSAFLPC